jgi:hypothetical protein
MKETIQCEKCGTTLVPRGELGLNCPRCLLLLVSDDDDGPLGWLRCRTLKPSDTSRDSRPAR